MKHHGFWEYFHQESERHLSDMNEHSRQLPQEELLKLALEELDKAQTDIGRLIRLHRQNLKVIEEQGVDVKSLPVISLTSRFAGTNFITHYLREKEYDRAFTWAAAVEGRLGQNIEFLRAFRDLESKRGEITSALGLAHRIASLDRKVSPAALRKLEGRVRELYGWIPQITGPRRQVSNVVRGRVLHLVKESRPHLSNGFTSRSHHNFMAEAEAGLDPIVLTEPGFPGTDAKHYTREESVDGVRHIRLGAGDIDYGGMPVDDFLQMFAELAYSEVLRTRPAIIHASSGRRGYDTALVGLALQEKTGLPFVYEVRSLFEANWTGDVEWETKGEIYTRRMQVEEMCMHRADRVLTIGESMRDELVARGIPTEKIGIIPNAVDVSSFAARSRSANLSASLGIGEYPTFGYVSNMDHYRESQETLIEACAILKDRGSSARCILVGGGPRAEALGALASRLGVGDRVIFTGPIDHTEIPDYYGLIDIFVVPRIAERAATYVTPLKPFEAMALKRPLVVSELPALLEIAEPPTRGRSFPPGDAEALADTLEGLYLNPDWRETMVENAYSWVAEHRTWRSNGERYVSEFAKISSKEFPK